MKQEQKLVFLVPLALELGMKQLLVLVVEALQDQMEPEKFLAKGLEQKKILEKH
jgi:hypothetical protein